MQELKGLHKLRQLLHAHLGGPSEYIMFGQEFGVVGGAFFCLLLLPMWVGTKTPRRERKTNEYTPPPYPTPLPHPTTQTGASFANQLGAIALIVYARSRDVRAGHFEMTAVPKAGGALLVGCRFRVVDGPVGGVDGWLPCTIHPIIPGRPTCGRKSIH